MYVIREITPVSYTHLDVYKRQVIRLFLALVIIVVLFDRIGGADNDPSVRLFSDGGRQIQPFLARHCTKNTLRVSGQLKALEALSFL